MAEKGPKGFTLTEAARRAGVSAAAPYRHFADKAELLATVAEQGFRDLHAEMAAVADTTPDPKGRVIELGGAYVRWAVAHPDHYRVMFGAEIYKADHPTSPSPPSRRSVTCSTRSRRARRRASRRSRPARDRRAAVVAGARRRVACHRRRTRAVGIEQDPEAMIAAVVARMLSG